ncbi:hypothetical protein KNJ79_04940 [Sphingopyxis indica]|uniref:hypothetical protein n=1 Tax=Sphingopyxis indica TaxID=436663 RepID=UPI002938DE45|nr:hypothetical protein [Sphingopyxis indica]WOF44277.1 hypothetical protein KNJ79_04940 [Sphingopyxis indica]
MIHIYDGNNVRLRAMTKPSLPGQKRLSLRQEYERSQTGSHIWCWDGARHNDRRKALYPAYKAKREPMAEDHFAQIRLFRELLTLSPAQQFCVEEWEADDVVATLARRFAARGIPVTCHSNDLDYLQLEANPLIKIEGIRREARVVAPRWVPLYKALRGDSSDNISGVVGFGPLTWERSEPYWPDLEAAIRLGSLHAFEHIPLPSRVMAWLHEPGNLEVLQNMLLITHMFEVPEDALNKGAIPGNNDPIAAEALLSRYFL